MYALLYCKKILCTYICLRNNKVILNYTLDVMMREHFFERYDIHSRIFDDVMTRPYDYYVGPARHCDHTVTK